MDHLLELFHFLAGRSEPFIILLLILVFLLVAFLFTRKIIIRKNQYYFSINDKEEKVKELEKEVTSPPDSSKDL